MHYEDYIGNMARLAVELANDGGTEHLSPVSLMMFTDHAVARGDLLLESYAVRHLGSQAWDAGESDRAIALFERSLDLRAARAARPHTAAAQAALAEVLGAESDRAASLRSAVAATAAELDLGWLK